jgi:hypothetical protein
MRNLIISAGLWLALGGPALACGGIGQSPCSNFDPHAPYYEPNRPQLPPLRPYEPPRSSTTTTVTTTTRRDSYSNPYGSTYNPNPYGR